MNPQDGRDMDRPVPGSVRRARERAAAGLPREPVQSEQMQNARPPAPRQPSAAPTPGLPRGVRPQPAFPLQTRDGQIGVPISRPAPAPQWPLQEPIIAPAQVDGEPFRPPAATSQPPQRPPRPSRVPSILDSSRVQDHTPVFQYTPRDSLNQELGVVPETPGSSVSRPSTLSSAGSIPDFPLPIQLPPGPPRRSVNLGPPPSARRGASSFYSNASFVSPIPEESPHTRSHASFASSAAMPDNWGSPSPGPSPDYPDPVYGEAIAEERGLSPDGDDDTDQLVRSASLGKRAKPTLVTANAARETGSAGSDERPGPLPLQGPFRNGTGYLENSSSSGTIPTVARPPPIGAALTADSMLTAYSSASAEDPSIPSARNTPSPNLQAPPGGRPYSRLSAIRRPPRLDIDAVRKAEARGSLTSLPDLIRRATRLAASLEKGRRPASRFDDLDDFPDLGGVDIEKHQSGLSDMLAAFPPPAHPALANQNRRSIRDSIREQVQSWPLPLNFNRTNNTSQEAVPNSDSQQADPKKRRRCCGLPLWAFIIIVVLALVAIAAAVVIPVELLVVHKSNGSNSVTQEELQQCRQQLTCANGGTNVVSEGVCSCICANGFSGSGCTVAGTIGCASISLTGSDNISNVTIGDGLPRLLLQAQTNFSVPLAANQILAKLNAGNLSCTAENALVTFDGRATRVDDEAVVSADSVNAAAAAAVTIDDDGLIFTSTATVIVEPYTTFTLTYPLLTTTTTTTTTTKPSTTVTTHPRATATSMVTTTMTMSSGAVLPTSPSASSASASASATGFVVSEDALDFARVAVLFVLQGTGVEEASQAQMALQKVFSSAQSSSSSSGGGGGVSIDAARNVTVGDGRSVDLVDFVVDIGGEGGRAGKGVSVDQAAAAEATAATVATVEVVKVHARGVAEVREVGGGKGGGNGNGHRPLGGPPPGGLGFLGWVVG